MRHDSVPLRMSTSATHALNIVVPPSVMSGPNDEEMSNSEQVVPGIVVDPPGSPAQTPLSQPIPSPQDPSQYPEDDLPQNQPLLIPANALSSNTSTPLGPPSTTSASSKPQAQTPFTKDDKTGMATMAGRRHKVVLAPGHSHMDWVRKTNTENNLSGTGGRLLRVGRSELAKHNSKDDAWLALRGKVYNITPYMGFHPGGEDELVRGLGKDATRLFDHKHTWVNAESLLAKCLVGYFIPNE